MISKRMTMLFSYSISSIRVRMKISAYRSKIVCSVQDQHISIPRMNDEADLVVPAWIKFVMHVYWNYSFDVCKLTLTQSYTGHYGFPVLIYWSIACPS